MGMEWVVWGWGGQCGDGVGSVGMGWAGGGYDGVGDGVGSVGMGWVVWGWGG